MLKLVHKIIVFCPVDNNNNDNDDDDDVQADVSLALSALQVVGVRVLTFIILFNNDVKGVRSAAISLASCWTDRLSSSLFGSVKTFWLRISSVCRKESVEGARRRSGLKHPENIHAANLLGPAV